MNENVETMFDMQCERRCDFDWIRLQAEMACMQSSRLRLWLLSLLGLH